jgi:hypothetical protein
LARKDELIRALRDYLIAEGLVRHADTPASPLPPVWATPEGGAVAPGDKSAPQDHPDLVLSIFDSGGFSPPTPHSSFLRRDTVDLRFRARRYHQASELEAQLRALLVGDIGRRGWNMGAVRVESCEEWRPFQPDPSAAGQPGHGAVWSLLFTYQA